MPRLRRRLAMAIALAIAALSVLGLAACGDDNGNSSAAGKNVDQLLKETFGPNKGVSSGKVDVGINLNIKGLQGLSGPVAIKLTGPFQSAGKKQRPKFDLALNLSASGQSFTAGAISTSSKGYLKVQGQAYEVPARLFNQFKTLYSQAQKEQKSKGESTTLKSLGVDPRNWLTGARKAGTADVAGTKTVHITAKIDVQKFLVDVNRLLAKADALGFAGTVGATPSKLTAKQLQDIRRAVKSATVDVYTGSEDTVMRRLTIHVKLAVPTDVRGAVGGLQSGDIAFDLILADLNEDQTISEPSDVKPLSDLTGALGGLFGGGSSGSGSNGSGSGSSSIPSTGNSKKYLDCLRAAGQDIAKVQTCAKLLTK